MGVRHRIPASVLIHPFCRAYRAKLQGPGGDSSRKQDQPGELQRDLSVDAAVQPFAHLPLLPPRRPSNDSSIIYTSSGIGDTSFMANGWLWDPRENSRGNIQLGVGLLLPTGKDNVANVV